jgi:hypothetical protein
MFILTKTAKSYRDRNPNMRECARLQPASKNMSTKGKKQHFPSSQKKLQSHPQTKIAKEK